MIEYLKETYSKLTEQRWWYTFVVTFRWVLFSVTGLTAFVFTLWNGYWILLWVTAIICITILIVALRVTEDDLIEKK